MAAIQRKPGLHGMVECVDVEPSDVHRGSAMFSVALLAVPRHIAVNTSSPRNSLGDGLMAGEAFRRGESAARLVALLAVGQPFELRVSFRERSRRDQGPDLCIRGRRDR
jgi:hypothetical protein